MKCGADEIIHVYVCVQVHFTCVHIAGCVCLSAGGSVGVDDGLICLDSSNS